MTDEQIIKALECCSYATSNKDCEKCPYYPDEECVKKQFTDILDLINRLKAENEKLETVERLADKTIATLTAENEKLQHENLNCKSEAIREFAERLNLTFGKAIDRIPKNSKAFSLKGDIIHDVHLIIDHVKKEMVGDSE